jgi:tetratricopeptide (TPR) repeat protein
MSTGEYDVFLSHAWADGERPRQIAEALAQAGLRVWFDANRFDDCANITRTLTEGLARSKALLAYHSATYPLRRASQWELTAAFLAAQAEGDPRRRVLIVNPESGACHIHPIELRESRFLKPPHTAGEMQQLVKSVAEHVLQLATSFSVILPLTAPNWYGIKPVGSTRFVGRLQEMWQVHSLLRAAEVSQVPGASAGNSGVVQVQGLGGVGKSLLAEEYALHFGAAYPGGVFWLRAYGNDDSQTAMGPQEREALRSDQLRRIAACLGIHAHGLTGEQIEGALARKMAAEGKSCLWVVDDAPSGMDPVDLRRWFAPHPLARTLITTRSREYGSPARVIELSALTADEAHELLTSRRPPANESEDNEARLLAEDLGRHPLALDLTASALVSYGGDEPYRKIRKQLARRDDYALELATETAHALPAGHEKCISQTLLGSIRSLGDAGLDFLRLASVLAVAPIPASLVTAVFEVADGLDSDTAEQHQRKAFSDLTRASLINVAGEKQTERAVHPLLFRAMRFHEKAQPGRPQALRDAAVEALISDIARVAADQKLNQQIEFHVAHARHLASNPTSVNEAYLAGWLARYDYGRGEYASAEALYGREFLFHQDRQGPGRPDTLASMRHLGLALYAQGDLIAARKLHKEALEISRRVLGPQHPDTLTSMNDLATDLWAQGDSAGARKLLEVAIDISRFVLGPDHPDTFKSMSNLAVTLRAQGDFAGARKLQRDALDISRRVLGPEHPDTLTLMKNLAETLEDQGDFLPARRLLEEGLSVRRRALGPEHPDTSDSAWNLFIALQDSSDDAAARRVLNRDLRWLLDRNPTTLDAGQQKIREYVAQAAKDYPSVAR